MQATNVVLFDTQYVPATETEMFASPDDGAGTIIDKFTTTNLDSVTRTILVRLVPAGETPTGVDFIVKSKQLAAGQCYLWPEIAGQMLDAGGSIRMDCDAADIVTTRASGRNLLED